MEHPLSEVVSGSKDNPMHGFIHGHDCRRIISNDGSDESGSCPAFQKAGQVTLFLS